MENVVLVEFLLVVKLPFYYAMFANPLILTALAHYSDAVDVYNSVTGVWSTAKLSVARADLAGASVGNTVLIAGGNIGNAV